MSEDISLSISGLTISEERLAFRYEVQNDSEDEIWLCDDVDVNSPIDFEVVATIDGYSLLVHLRVGMPIGWWRLEPPDAKYVRLAPGENYGGTIWLKLPVRQQPVFTGRSAHRPEELRNAQRLIFEVGYFMGDLSEKTERLVREANRALLEQNAEDERLTIEEDKLQKRELELSETLRGTTDEAERERLQVKLQELQSQREYLDDTWMSVDRTSLYLRGLGLEIPLGLLGAFKNISPQLAANRNELKVPYDLQEVEKEHFLRASLDNVTVYYLPPRYLDLMQGVPWGKESGNSGKMGVKPTHLTPLKNLGIPGTPWEELGRN